MRVKGSKQDDQGAKISHATEGAVPGGKLRVECGESREQARGRAGTGEEGPKRGCMLNVDD